MCGRFLSQILVQDSQRSTPVGRFLLPVLLGFRLALLAASGPGVYSDDQSEFVCHTQQPGCKAACYDASHPLSPLRFWTFHVILVAVPSVLYAGLTVCHVIEHWEEPGKVKKEEESLIHEGDGCRESSGAGNRKILWAYVVQLGTRVILEGAALGGQYHLYGFKVPNSFSCRRDPCLGSITCTLSRPAEKTIFLKTMFGVSGLCLLFTLLELVLLGLRKLWKIQKHRFSSFNCFSTSRSTTKRKEPTNNFPVVEIKE